MGIKLEDRKPITEILQQTPEIPGSCQWCLFLRNHDELTLEMVTDLERDYMYDVYARTKVMRLNLGIRRRLAPLLDNDRRRIELMNGLLLSLPGTPFGSAFGVLRKGMAQERMCDPRVSKIYVPLAGEAALIAEGERVPLRPGSVYLIPAGTEHEVEHAGEEEFVNFCLWWEERPDG